MPIYLPDEEPKAAVDYSEPLPKGRYPALVSEATPGQSKGGNEMVTVVFEVQGGKRIWDYLTLSEAALGILARKLKGLGLPYRGVQYDAESLAYALVGRACVLDLIIEKDNKGNLRNKVFDILPADTVIDNTPAPFAPTASASNPYPVPSGNTDLPF